MKHTRSKFDDDFLIDLRDTLACGLNKAQLKDLSTSLEIDYDRLPGPSEADKLAALIATLRESGRVDALIGEAKSQGLLTTSDSSDKHPKSTGRGKTTGRRDERLERRKAFLRSLFDGEPIALEEELCKSWEFLATKAVHTLRPKHVKRKITALSKSFDSIDFLHNQQNSSLEDQQPSKVPGDLSLPDVGFVNSHSIRLWYAGIRRDFQLPFMLIAFAIGLLLFGFVAYSWGFLVSLSGSGISSFITDASEPSVVHDFQESGTYYLEVKDPASRNPDYWVGVFGSPSDSVTPDFSEKSTWPLSYGDRVLSELQLGEQHLYRIGGSEGDVVIVDAYDRYADSDLNFALLDSRMNQCDSVKLSFRDQRKDGRLICSIATGKTLHLRVQAEAPGKASRIPISFSSRYGFRVYKAIEDKRLEPNDSESSTPIDLGSVIWDGLNKKGRAYYHFTAQAGEQLEISAGNLSDSPLSSVTLYQLVDGEPVVVAHSNESAGTTMLPYLSTSYGRAYALAFLLESLGLPIDATDIESPSLWCFYVLLGLAFLCFALYAFFVKCLSLRNYEESLAVKRVIDVLLALTDAAALNSESGKASIRADIKLASDAVQKIHRISRFPPLHAAPASMREHMLRIASQVRQMNEVVSTPAEEDRSLLRRKFTGWLTVLLTAEYGMFQFDDDFEMEPMPWHRQLTYSLQRHWKGITILTILFLTAIGLTHRIWRQYTNDISRIVWQAIRYVILIAASYAIYDRWGTKGPSERQQNKWEHLVKLIVFFFVPLLGLDALLRTGIVESIIKLMGNLKGIL